MSVVEVPSEVDGEDVSGVDASARVPDSPAVLFLVNEEYEESKTDSGID